MSHPRLTYYVAVALGFGAFCLLTGCGPPGLQQVKGKVTFVGGTPQSEVAAIRFDPVAGTTLPEQSQVASGKISPDGSYSVSTPAGEGAYVGEYKVCFTVLKQYGGNESQIDAKFTKPATTPFTVKVEKGGNTFDFELTKAPGH